MANVLEWSKDPEDYASTIRASIAGQALQVKIKKQSRRGYTMILKTKELFISNRGRGSIG